MVVVFGCDPRKAFLHYALDNATGRIGI